MSALLRKVKATVNESNNEQGRSSRNNSSTPSQSTTTSRANNNRAPDLSNKHPTLRLRKPSERIITATRRPPGPEISRTRSQPLRHESPQQPHHPLLTDFRRRLVHKASTFSLRAKRWRHERELPSSEIEAAKEEELRKESDFLNSEDIQVFEQTHREFQGIPSSTVQAAIAQKDEAKVLRERDLQLRDAQQAIHKHQRTVTTTSSASTILPATTTAFTQSTEDDEVGPDKGICYQGISSPQPRPHGYHPSRNFEEGNKALVRVMAAEHATPPVTFLRLKEITESACETALSGVTAYSHSDTESWNTTIINNILGALVAETTQQSTSGSSSGQPQFKYVVNSTIIQHASTSSTAAASTPGDEQAKKNGGRRGMHAASGAYWNNEKDGMWSFKYPGADSKGLDVVVGVIWVWVG